MTEQEAFRLYNYLKGYSTILKRVGFEFSTVPPVKLAAQTQSYQQFHNQVSKSVAYNGEKYIVEFSYSSLLVAQVKAVPDGKYSPDSKQWFFPLTSTKELKAFAEKNNFNIGSSAQRMFNGIENNYEASYSAEEIELNIPFKLKPFPFQSSGIDYMMKNESCINADDMGLGKTIQGIGAAYGLNAFPVLVICPKSLMGNWYDEVKKFTNKKPLLLNQKNIKSLENFVNLGMCDFAIINYDGVKTLFCDEVKEVEIKEGANKGKVRKSVIMNKMHEIFKCVIIDEAHELRNHKTVRYKTVRAVTKGKKHVFPLTGTPFVNTAQDIASLLELSNRIDEFGGMYRFVKAAKDMKKGYFDSGNNNSGNSDLAALNIKLRSLCFIRREKFQVLKDLPDKLRQIIHIDISNRAEYDHAFISLQDYLASQKVDPENIASSMRAELLSRFRVLAQISSEGKFEAFKDFAGRIIEHEKLVVFCWYKNTINKIKELFPNVLTIYGDNTPEEIDKNKKLFQNDEKYRIIVCSYKKGYAGHTLTAASKMVKLELSWTAAMEDQAEDRIHRIGQKDMVNIYYLLGRDTVDDHMYSIIDAKRQAGKAATGSSGEIETNMVDDLTKLIVGSNLKSDNAEIPEYEVLKSKSFNHVNSETKTLQLF
jgi:SWI/SNF-related matrix-associated actin-dependent regulator 1 of chromatin subfamily A